MRTARTRSSEPGILRGIGARQIRYHANGSHLQYCIVPPDGSALHPDIDGLYVAHHGWLSGWLRRRLGNETDAADIAQDVFLKLLSRAERARLREPRAYLSTIARGLVVEHWRRRELELAWLETLAALPPVEVPSPERRLLLLETLIEIDRMLDSLKPAVRTAFLLAQLDGYSCPRIAEHLGVSLATAERHVAKALRQCYRFRFES